MKIINVRLAQHIPLGFDVVPDNFLERGRSLGSSRISDIQTYDTMFLKVSYSCTPHDACPAGRYNQFIPWAQVATVIFDDTPAEKSPA